MKGHLILSSLTLVWRWALCQEFTFGDKLVALCGSVCRAWNHATKNPVSLLQGLTRVISFDIGIKHFAVWYGSLLLQGNEKEVEQVADQIMQGTANHLPQYKIHGWEVIDLGSSHPFEACFNALHCLLKQHPWLSPRFYNRVYIESQPCLRAAQMQILSAGVFAYFHTLALQMDLELQLTREFVKVITAKRKLDTLWSGPVPNPPRPPTGSKASAYRYRKQLGTAIARAKLDLYQGSSLWQAWFDSLEKKDDAADAKTQALREFVQIIIERANESRKKKRKVVVGKKKSITKKALTSKKR